MGFMLVTGACVACRAVFSFNPNHVPSIRVKGERQPVCRPCIESANARREKVGLAAFPILPDAYEPAEVSP